MFASKEDLETAKKSLKRCLAETDDEEEKAKARKALKALGDPDHVDDDHDEDDKAQARAYATLSTAAQVSVDRMKPIERSAYLRALSEQLGKVDAAKREKVDAVHARLSPQERDLLERTSPTKARANRPTMTGNSFTMPQSLSRAEAAALAAEIEKEGI